MIWLPPPPSGFGWNVETITWLQLSAVEAGLVYGVAWLIHEFKPLIARMPRLLRLADTYAPEHESEADKELKKHHEP